MTVFVDTSAFYALVDEDDRHHSSAVARWRDLLDRERLVTHAHVVIEASALVQRRLGMPAASRLHEALLPPVRVLFVDSVTHSRSVERWLTSAQRGLSLVDVTSFVVMQSHGISEAFAYDVDFGAAGFSTSS